MATRAGNACSDLSKEENILETDYESALRNFEKRLETLDDAQSKLEVVLPEEQLDAEMETAAVYRHKQEKARNRLVTAFHSASSVSTDGQSSVQQSVKLPKLDLPKFSGDLLKFTSFWQQFDSCIDSREDLSYIAKFNYLVGLLKGEAKRVLDGLPITHENYDEAKRIIEHRFGRKEALVFSHI